MEYIWNENYPIAIHVTEGEYTPEQLQYIANTDQLIVRDMRANAAGSSRVPSIDYYPKNAWQAAAVWYIKYRKGKLKRKIENDNLAKQ